MLSISLPFLLSPVILQFSVFIYLFFYFELFTVLISVDFQDFIFVLSPSFFNPHSSSPPVTPHSSSPPVTPRSSSIPYPSLLFPIHSFPHPISLFPSVPSQPSPPSPLFHFFFYSFFLLFLTFSFCCRTRTPLQECGT